MMESSIGTPAYDTLDNIRKCFDGLCLYAARQAARGKDTSELRDFALTMASFWGLDEDENSGDHFELEFDHAVLEAAETDSAPEISGDGKADILSGLYCYQMELDVVGGPEDSSRQCRSLLDSLRQEWKMSRQEPSAALADRSAEEKEVVLLRRLDRCLLQHAAVISTGEGHPAIGELYKLAPLISTHEYLSGHGFSDEELNALLRFRDPLETLCVCGEVGNPIVELSICESLERGRAEERFPLMDTHPPAQTEKTPVRKNRSAGRNRGR